MQPGGPSPPDYSVSVLLGMGGWSVQGVFEASVVTPVMTHSPPWPPVLADAAQRGRYGRAPHAPDDRRALFDVDTANRGQVQPSPPGPRG